jgi:hypothetical protein
MLQNSFFILISTISLLLLFIVFSFAKEATSKELKKDESNKNYFPSEQLQETIPDHTNPKNKQKIKCSACKVIAEELYFGLTALAKKNNNRPRRDQQTDFFDKVCAKMKTDYGLLMRNNAATLEFSRDADISRIKGSWVNFRLEEHCLSLLDQDEDEILEEFKKSKDDFVSFQKFVCKKIDKVCVGKKESFGLSSFAKKSKGEWDL